MDWVDDDQRLPGDVSPGQDFWREHRESSRGDTRGDSRASRKGLEDRLETWVSRGRDLVDGVSGTRPGTRPSVRGSERLGPAGRSGLDGLGRWVEGRLDWLLDDREDWREPWQETERPTPDRRGPSPAPQRLTRPPLDAISRRGRPLPDPGGPVGPGDEATRARPAEPPTPSRDWPEEDLFSVPRWRREDPSPPRPANPLGNLAPLPPPGRPLPRSTRRR
jgi:hypothetical protein